MGILTVSGNALNIKYPFLKFSIHSKASGCRSFKIFHFFDADEDEYVWKKVNLPFLALKISQSRTNNPPPTKYATTSRISGVDEKPIPSQTIDNPIAQKSVVPINLRVLEDNF